VSFPPRIKYGINSSGNPVLLIKMDKILIDAIGGSKIQVVIYCMFDLLM
jgi:hypothetical protein